MDIRLVENSMIAKLAARILKSERVAVTISDKIYLHNCAAEDFLKNKTWVCHEIAHIMQYKKMGTLKFITQYLFQSLVKGYFKNKFEKEAREKENDLSLMEGINFFNQ